MSDQTERDREFYETDPHITLDWEATVAQYEPGYGVQHLYAELWIPVPTKREWWERATGRR